VKKIVCLLLLLVGSGCSSYSKQSSDPQNKETGKIKVLSSIAMIDDIVGEIAGDRVEHSALIIGEIDPHSYELVKGDDERIDQATLVFFNGLNLEHGASLQHKLLSHSFAMALGDLLLQAHPEQVLFEQGQPDPHIWMDVSLWMHIVDPISKALSLKDPEGREFYEGRANALKEKMRHFHEELTHKMQNIPQEKRYLVTSHDAFSYFTRAYLALEGEKQSGAWRKRFAAPEGLAPEGQLGIADLQKIVDYLREYRIHVVFPESNVSKDSLQKIVLACRAKNQNIHFSQKPLYGDSMGARGTPSGNYLGMIEHNAQVLIEEWE